MKKALSLFLALILCLSLCACGSANTSNGQNKKTVTLTAANFHNYFDVNAYSGDFSETIKGSPSHVKSNCTVTISITPRYNIEANDVTVTFDVQENLKWAYWNFSDAYYEGGPNVMYRTCYIDIKLPSSGKTEKKMVGTYDALGSSMASNMPIPKITSVSGTITITE